ncbi:unnamed protein product, partial [Brassica oleracea]
MIKEFAALPPKPILFLLFNIKMLIPTLEIFGDSCGSSATTLSKRKSQEERDNDVEDQLFVNKKHSKK